MCPPTNTSLLLFSVALFSALTAHYIVDAHIVFFTVGTQKFIVQLVENAFFALLFVTAHTANFLVNFDVVKSATWTFFVFQRQTPTLLPHYEKGQISVTPACSTSLKIAQISMPPTKVQHGFFSLQNAKGKLSDSCAKYSNIACHKQTRLATNKHNLLQITSLCYKSPRLATNHLA